MSSKAKSRSRTPEYRSWEHMRDRCANPCAHNYARYGGRGIKVCDRWRESFETFLADMGPRPSLEHTLDRIDNDGNYEPGNCRWATRMVQNHNRPKHRRWPWTVSRISTMFGIGVDAYKAGIASGLSLVDLLNRRCQRVIADAKCRELSERAQVSMTAIRHRLKRGVSDGGLTAPQRAQPARVCGACGRTGHNRLTCARRAEVA